MTQLGFIGVGNMATALIRGICSKVDGSDVLAFNRHMQRVAPLVEELGIVPAASASAVACESEFVVIGVQPNQIDGVLDEIAPALAIAVRAGHKPVLCSLAAGYPLADLEQALSARGLSLPVVRIMPNTGVGVQKGVCLFTANDQVESEHMERLLDLFAGTGLCESVTEEVLEAAIPVFSCSPAYFFIFIEALADAGSQLGLERDLAMRLATQAMYGSAAYAIETGKHVAQLREELATPNGMTITSTNYMESLGFRAAVIGGVLKAHEHATELR